MIVRPTTRGAQALDEFLRNGGQTLHAFCESNGLDYAQAHRNMSGARGKRVSVDFATAIESATGGRVAACLWCQGTLEPSSVDAQPEDPEHLDAISEHIRAAVNAARAAHDAPKLAAAVATARNETGAVELLHDATVAVTRGAA